MRLRTNVLSPLHDGLLIGVGRSTLQINENKIAYKINLRSIDTTLLNSLRIYGVNSPKSNTFKGSGHFASKTLRAKRRSTCLLKKKKELQLRAKSNFIASEAADRDRNTSLIRRSARGDPQETYLGK